MHIREWNKVLGKSAIKKGGHFSRGRPFKLSISGGRKKKNEEEKGVEEERKEEEEERKTEVIHLLINLNF